MWCDVYKWRGHYYDTPLHNEAGDSVNIIKKCRCGKTKDEIRYVPLPDTEESLTYKRINDVYDYKESIPITKIIMGVVFLLVALTLIPSLFAAVNRTACAMNNPLSPNATTDCAKEFTGIIPSWLLLVIGLMILSFVFSKFLRLRDY